MSSVVDVGDKQNNPSNWTKNMPATSATSKSVIFVDSRVNNYQAFIDGLTEPAEVFVLNGESDGLDQMAAALRGYSGIDAIHVISHGSQGVLYLGSTLLNSGNLGAYSSRLSTIGNALTQSGDILLYGCNVALGDVGLQFIQTLAQYTGADVAASEDATGEEALGGNWTLERAYGSVESSSRIGSGIPELLAANSAPTFVIGNGKVTIDFPGNDSLAAMTIQPDGKILLGGYSRQLDQGSNDFALARLSVDGTLDNSFDLDGLVKTDFGQNEYGNFKLIVRLDGKIDAVGFANYRDGTISKNLTLTARYDQTGSLDNSFDGDGKYSAPYGETDFGYVQSDGKVLTAGQGSELSGGKGTDFLITRYDANGALDTSFDLNGKVSTDMGGQDSANALTVLPNGQILAVGTTGFDFALARYSANGSLDTTFDGDGKVTTNFGLNAYASATSVALLPNGKYFVAGNVLSITQGGAIPNTDFAMARYNSDGSLDTSFDGDGKLTTDFGFNDNSVSVAVQSDGKILVAGTVVNAAGNSDFGIVRYNIDGSLDTSFGLVRTLDVTATYTGASPIVLDTKVQIFDAELSTANNFSGASVTLVRHGGGVSTDVFSAKAGGSLTSLTTGNYFSVDGVTIGRVVANLAGTLTLGFSTGATQLLVNKTLQQIAYANTATIPPVKVQIDWSFNDGNSGAQGVGGSLLGTGSSNVLIAVRNVVPVVATPLPDLNILLGSSLNYALSSTAFTDANVGEILRYSIATTDGSPLPPWLTFNGGTAVFGGKPSAFDLGSSNLRVTATDSFGASVSDILTITVGPTVTGTIKQGSTLSANRDTVNFDGLSSISYQWMANGAPITGAVNSSFVLSQDQVGKSISVTVSYSHDGGMVESLTSSATSSVLNVNDLPTGTVTFAGKLMQGQTLIASNSLVDSDGIGTISYQWLADGSAIAGATGATFILPETVVGKAISLVASYTDGFGATERANSAQSSVVLALDNTPPTVSTFVPADEAKDVAIASNITFRFSEPIVKGTGAVVLKTSSGTTVETFDPSTSTRLSISGSTLTVDPTADLAFGAGYKLEFSANSFKDLAGNAYAGTTSYNFTTIADPANQTFTGNATNESFTGGTGNDTIDGGAGIDTSIYSGSRSSYTLTLGASTTVQDKRTTAQSDGNDSLTSIERLKFSDVNIATDLEGHAGQAAKLLGAVFGTASVANQQFVGIALTLLDSGMSYEQLATAALGVTGKSTNFEVASLLWTNLFGSAPTSDQVAPIVAILDDGMSQGALTVLVADTSFNTEKINLVGLTQNGIEYL